MKKITKKQQEAVRKELDKLSSDKTEKCTLCNIELTSTVMDISKKTGGSIRYICTELIDEINSSLPEDLQVSFRALYNRVNRTLHKGKKIKKVSKIDKVEVNTIKHDPKKNAEESIGCALDMCDYVFLHVDHLEMVKAKLLRQIKSITEPEVYDMILEVCGLEKDITIDDECALRRDLTLDFIYEHGTKVQIDFMEVGLDNDLLYSLFNKVRSEVKNLDPKYDKITRIYV